MKEDEARRLFEKQNPEWSAFARFCRDTGVLHDEDSAKTAEELTVVGGDRPWVNGSLRRSCATCKCWVYLSPETQAMLAERGDKPVEFSCWECAYGPMWRQMHE